MKNCPHIKTPKEQAEIFVGFLKLIVAVSKNKEAVKEIAGRLRANGQVDLAVMVEGDFKRTIKGLRPCSELLESLKQALPFLEYKEKEKKKPTIVIPVDVNRRITGKILTSMTGRVKLNG